MMKLHSTAIIQHPCFQSLGKRTTGRSWATLLIVQLWQLLWNQWDHRNEVDKNTMHLERQLQIEALDERIQNEYELGPTNLLNYDRQFF